MSYFLKRRLRTISGRISRAQDELSVLEQQLLQLVEEADDAQVRSVVSDAPADSVAYDAARRQHDIISRECDRQRKDIDGLMTARDQLLDRLAEKTKSSTRN